MPPVNNNNISLTIPVVLLAPLDWGLGHTTRCIPIIKSLLSLGCHVIVAVDAKQQALLEQEFSNIRFVPLNGYRLEYGRTGLHTIIKIITQIPKIVSAVYNENKWLYRFIQSNQLHAVISDNRYGFYTKKLPSIFITHQLVIKSPFGKIMQKLIQMINYQFIKKFTACWVPDYRGNSNLAGELSHPEKMPSLPVSYLGRLSRLSGRINTEDSGRLLIILSGPEPQRSIFEETLLKELQNFPKPAVVVRGLPKESKNLKVSNTNVVIYNYLSSAKLEVLITQAETIISRSGYSTVMDLAGRGKKCIFIPTPGQPEQEYLAVYLQQKKLCISFSQKKFSLENALRKAQEFSYSTLNDLPADAYQDVLESFVLKLKSNGKLLY